MRFRRAIFCLTLVCLLRGGGVNAEESVRPAPVSRPWISPLPALTNAAQCRSLTRQAANRGYRLRLEGTLTRVDASSELLVVQDASGALAVKMEPMEAGLRPGQRVVLEGDEVSPGVTAFPDYPNRPSGRERLSAFKGPTDWDYYYATRVRGLLHPPASGDYTFWIASDDSSELWLSTNADPVNARKIAFVPTGGSTRPEVWNKYRSQASTAIPLRAGDTCYIEAIHQQRAGHNNLAVAWQGPGIAQAVLAGAFLSPWADPAQPASPVESRDFTTGILREYWTNFFVDSVAPLTEPGPGAAPVTLKHARVLVVGEGPLPEPLRITAERPPAEGDDYRWIEVEGTVEFPACDGAILTLDLTDGPAPLRVRVMNWIGDTAPLLGKARVRVRGVYQSALGLNGRPGGGVLWTPSPRELTLLEPTEESWAVLQPTLIANLTPANPGLARGGRVKVQGNVVSQQSGHSLLIESVDCFYGYASRDGSNWVRIAPPVEIVLGPSPVAGVAVASFTTNSLTTAVFDHVKGLTDAAQSVGINDPGLKGSASYDGSGYTLKGGGLGIGSTWDQFHFLCQPLDGATEFVARVSSVTGSNPRAKAGIVVRESFDNSVPFAGVALTPTGDAVFQFRRQAGVPGDMVSLPGYPAPAWLKLARRRLPLRVYSGQAQFISPGQTIEVIGFLGWEHGVAVLQRARFRPLPPELSPAPAAVSGEAPAPLGDAINVPIRDIVSERGEMLKRGSGALRIRGVVTFNDLVFDRNYLAIQDETAGVFVAMTDRLLRSGLQVGQWVELRGRRVKGRWPACFEPATITVCGPGRLPVPAIHPAEYSLIDQGQAHWTELEGIGRALAANGTLVVMGVDGPLPVWIGQTDASNGARYVDARISVRGVLSASAEGVPLLLTPSPGFVEIWEPAPADPFAIPTLPIGTATELKARARTVHRIKVAGVVTCSRQDLVTVQDASGGIGFHVLTPPAVTVGDEVEVVGFPPETPGLPVLTEAVLRKVAAVKRPPPAERSVDEILAGRHGASLVRVEALLLEQRIHGGDQLLELQAGEIGFQARLAASQGMIGRIPVGSRVAVTGVCWAEGVGDVSPSRTREHEPLAASLGLLLRSPQDVVLIQRPPWWTWKHTSATIGGLVAAVVGTLVWIRRLHQRVAERNRELQEALTRLERKTKIATTLTERDRLAGEIHDGLEQGLSGIMMQLDAVESKLDESPGAARDYLETARNMVRFSRAEVRHSLWNLQSPALANADLATALSEVSRQMGAGNQSRLKVEVSGPARPLAPATEHHLLRICQEALTNALKHSQAGTVQVRLSYRERSVSLSVSDDGCGFDPATVLTGTAGHLGLRNLRSRVRKIGGQLTVTSEPGKGATIEVTVGIDGGIGGST
jgi:signal transduction histidine kinase